MAPLKKQSQDENPHKGGLFGYPSRRHQLRRMVARKARRGFSVLKKQAPRMVIDDQHLHLLAEALPQIIWTADPNGFQDYFSRKWFAYTGLSEKETYGGKTALHPSDFVVYVRRWAKALKSGRAYEAEYRFRRGSDGTYRWHLVRGLPVKNSVGKIVKWIGTFTDIDDQKRVQERVRKLNEELEKKVEERTKELQEARDRDRANLERLRNALGSMTFGAYMSDENLTVLYVNDQCLEMFGLSPNERKKFIGKTSSKTLFSFTRAIRDPKQYIKDLEQTFKIRKPELGTEITMRDGRILLRDYIPIYERGKFRGQLFIFRDVTRERRVDTAKSEFMSLASHQLRTPLTAIRWALGRISKQCPEPGQVTNLIEAARRASRAMSDTINTMLSISRIEAGTITVSSADVRLKDLLIEVREFFKEEFKARKQTVAIHCAQSLMLQTDPKLLKEVLSNVFSNAIKYSPDHSAIVVRARKEDSFLFIDIEDEGYGIPENQKEKVFEKFFRGDNVAEKFTEGTGLGLYLVALLMKTLKGKIAFVSEEGAGTTFSLLLPLTKK